MAERETGVVKWFNNAKGYGFIEPDGGGEDIFVHHSSITMDGYRTLTEGERVEFSLEAGQKGPAATSVQKLNGLAEE